MRQDATLELHPLPFLNRIRSLAMIMVIGVHAFGYASQYTGLSYEITRFLINTVPVSIFFLVDGYLFTHAIRTGKQFRYRQYLAQSVKKLLVPWLCFTLIYVFLRFIFELVDFFDRNLLVGQGMLDILLAIYTSSIAPQTYFLLSLFIIRVFSPLILQLLYLSNARIVMIISLYYVAYYYSFPGLLENTPLKQGQEPLIHAIWGAHFYLTGFLLYHFKFLFSRTLFYTLLFLFPVSLILRYVLKTDVSINLLQYHYLIVLFLLFFYFSMCFRVLDAFNHCTMGIYLIHAPVLLKATALMSQALTCLAVAQYFIIWISSLLLAWLVTRVLISFPIGCVILGQTWSPDYRLNVSSFFSQTQNKLLCRK